MTPRRYPGQDMLTVGPGLGPHCRAVNVDLALATPFPSSSTTRPAIVPVGAGCWAAAEENGRESASAIAEAKRARPVQSVMTAFLPPFVGSAAGVPHERTGTTLVAEAKKPEGWGHTCTIRQGSLRRRGLPKGRPGTTRPRG